MLVNVEKILIFGSLSYGSSIVDTSPNSPPISGFLKLTSQNKEFFFPGDDISFIYLKNAPKVINVGTVFNKILLFGEASFENARLLPQSSWSGLSIPDFLTNQIAFISDNRIVLSSERQVLSIEA